MRGISPVDRPAGKQGVPVVISSVAYVTSSNEATVFSMLMSSAALIVTA
jgi:hypothetical protein